MLNSDVGTPRDIGGRMCIETRPGASGHAVFGPYDLLDPGRYVVEFRLTPVEGQRFEEDPVCASVDIAVDHGNRVLERRDIRLAELAGGGASFPLAFELGERQRVEYRIGVTGAVPLIADDRRALVAASDDGTAVEAALAAKRFPDVGPDSPEFLRAHEETLRRYHQRGVDVSVQDGGVVLAVRGVTFHARCWDDLNFINEIFFESAYGVKTAADACVIDVGMNIGFASLLLATNPQVKEVHAFEPFRETYDRGLANIALNPALAAKIRTHNVGLSDADEDAVISVPDTHGDSGGASTRNVEGGTPVRIVLKDAGATLRPIIADARARGRDVILKVDCEGGEFAIFDALERDDLFRDVTAVMIEWHRVFDDKNEDDLIEPLKRAGFVVFDLTRPTGNGFFYAANVRQPAA